jgi:hypothetical protein
VSDDVTDTGQRDASDPDDVGSGGAADPVASEEPLASEELGDLATEYPDLAAWFAEQATPPMPDDVWDRLHSALAEQEPLSVAGVTPIHSRRHDRSAPRRSRRLAPILGAAAGLVLVGAVGIPVVLGGNAANPPVADGPTISEPSTATDPGGLTDPGGSAPSNDPADAQPTSPSQPGEVDSDPVTSPTDAAGSMMVPARYLVATGTDYSAEAMTPQVTSLLTSSGVANGADMATEVVAVHSSAPRGLPPLIGRSGFTADVDALRDCVSRLHASRGGDAAGIAMPALLVDRAQFQGADAGVVVMLHNEPGVKPYLDVAIVAPECTDADVASAVWFTYALP